MSDPSVIQQLLLEQVSNYIACSMDVLYFFDSCLMFSQEVEVIWGRKWSAITWIYAFTRYSAMLLVIFDLVPDQGYLNCRATMYILDALAQIQFLCFACFSALRIYALLDGKKFLAGIVFLLNLVPFATNLYNYAISVVVVDSEICATIVPESSSSALRLTLVTRAAVIIGDLLVLLVTWSQTARSYRESQRLGIKAPLVTLLFRDGTFYFLGIQSND